MINELDLGAALSGEMALDPPIKSLFVYNSNPVSQAPAQAKRPAWQGRTAGQVANGTEVSMAATLESTVRPPAMKGFATQVELHVLCICARVHLPEEFQQRLESLVGQDLDWSLLYQLAWRHRLFPLLYRHLKAHCAEAAPIDLMQKLH